MCEVDCDLQTLAQLFMAGELFAVVDGQRLTQRWRDDAERSFFGGVQPGTGAVFHLRCDQESALSFHTGHDHAGVTCTREPCRPPSHRSGGVYRLSRDAVRC